MVVHQEEGNYDIFLPDFKDATQGKTYNMAIEMSIDLIANHLYQLEINNKSIPQASNINDLDILKTIKDICGEEVQLVNCSTTIVSFDYDEYVKKVFNKLVKKTLSIPQWIDDKARANKINFSKFLTHSLIVYFKENNL